MELMNIRQASELLQVSVGTVRNMLRRNELPYLRVGKQIRFVRGDIDRWVRLRVRYGAQATPVRGPATALPRARSA